MDETHYESDRSDELWNEIKDAYESHWKEWAGWASDRNAPPPVAHKYLDKEGEAREHLLRRLLRTEFHFVEKNGLTLAPLSEYLAKYPDTDHKVICYAYDKAINPSPRAATAPRPAEPPPEQIGRYRIVKPLGSGGMADVYLAEVEGQSQLFALKVPKKQFRYYINFATALQEEAEAAMDVEKYKGFAGVKHIEEDPTLGSVLVMEYYAGGDLGRKMIQRWDQGEQWGVQEAAKLIAQIARALHSLHKAGSAHLDLKPSNILLDDNDKPYIADFGISQIYSNSDSEIDRETAGTPRYMAPEQWKGSIEPSCDIWALGVMLYELLCGDKPYEGNTVEFQKQLNSKTPIGNPATYRADIDEQLAKICLECLETDVEQRYQTALDLANALELWVKPGDSAEVTTDTRQRKFKQQRDDMLLDLERHLDGFVSRDHIVKEVEQFLTRERGLLVLTGEPGTGKTALLAHLALQEFTGDERTPITFAYRRVGELNTPDDFIRCVYADLHDKYGGQTLEQSLEESRQTGLQQMDPDELFRALQRYLREAVAQRASAENRQLIFVDALDEAASQANRTSNDRLRLDLPEGVFVIATSRPVEQVKQFETRPNCQVIDLNQPDWDTENKADGRRYVDQQLKDIVDETLRRQIAEVGAGNFLVLTLVVNEARLGIAEVTHLLSRAAQKKGTTERLGAIFEASLEHRRTGLSPELAQTADQLLNLIATIQGPVTVDFFWHVLCQQQPNVSLNDVTKVLDVLNEFLTQLPSEDFGQLYRAFHSAFTEYLRLRDPAVFKKENGRLADYCQCWSEHSAQFDREYALRFAPTHLRRAESWDDLEAILTDWRFLEAKNEAGRIFELAQDFSEAIKVLAADRPQRPIMALMAEALGRDIQFIHRHCQDYPQALFQCMWNTCWWYDCREAAAHYHDYTTQWDDPNRPLSKLLELWRTQKKESAPDCVWLRSLRPPEIRLGNTVCVRLQERSINRTAVHSDGWIVEGRGGHDGVIGSVAFSDDAGLLVSTGSDDAIRVWDLATFHEKAYIRADWMATNEHGLRHIPNFIDISQDGETIYTGSQVDGCVRVWRSSSGTYLQISYAAQSIECDAERTTETDLRTTAWMDHWRKESLLRPPHGPCYTLPGTYTAQLTGDDLACSALSPDESLVAIGVFATVNRAAHDCFAVHIYTANGSWLRTLRGHCAPVTCIAFSRDNAMIATGDREGSLMIWKLPDEIKDDQGMTFSCTLKGHLYSDEKIQNVKVSKSSNGRCVVSVSDKRTIVWHAKTVHSPTDFEGRGWSKKLRMATKKKQHSYLIDVNSKSATTTWRNQSGQIVAAFPQHLSHVDCDSSNTFWAAARLDYVTIIAMEGADIAP